MSGLTHFIRTCNRRWAINTDQRSKAQIPNLNFANKYIEVGIITECRTHKIGMA